MTSNTANSSLSFSIEPKPEAKPEPFAAPELTMKVVPPAAPAVPEPAPTISVPTSNVVIENVSVETASPPPQPDFREAVQDVLPKKAEPVSKVGMVAVFALIAALGMSYVYRHDIVNYVTGIGEFVSSPKDMLEKGSEKVKEALPEVAKLPPLEIPKRQPASILEARDYYLRLLHEDQSVSVRTGGSRSWRMNNPCSILWGRFARDKGAIGNADKYAVWLKYAEGRLACYDLLFKSEHGYKDKSVLDAMKRYAPLKEGFATDKYIKAMEKARINTKDKMSSLPEEKRQKLIDVLMEVEDFHAGRVSEYDDVKDFKKRGY